MEDIKKLQKKFGKIITKWLEKRDNIEDGDFSNESIYGPSKEDPKILNNNNWRIYK